MPTLSFAGLFSLLLATSVAGASTTVEYEIQTLRTQAGKASISGGTRLTTTIDGRAFRSVSGGGRYVEGSDDDGQTTRFGALDAPTVNTPLQPEHGHVLSPMVATIEDEQFSLGDSRPGPLMFGLATRTYTVNHDYAIQSRVAYLVGRRVVHRTRFTITVADIAVSPAAVRVALSRGYARALSQHDEAFSGLPLLVEGTIELPDGAVSIKVEATSLAR